MPSLLMLEGVCVWLAISLGSSPARQAFAREPVLLEQEAWRRIYAGE